MQMSLTSYKALLLDIEGTVAPISFVKDVLFPYAFANVEKFLRLKLSSIPVDLSISSLVSDLLELSNKEHETDRLRIRSVSLDGGDNVVECISANVREWINQDKKLTAVKTLQGLIWEKGYEDGEIKAPVFTDVVEFMSCDDHSWLPIFIYSSGSVHAQKLLFSHTSNGDFTHRISGFFDTKIGQKWEEESYQLISKDIGVEPEHILFLTDVEREAFAASKAGLQAFLVIRDGNAPLSNEAKRTYKCITNFKDLK